MTAAVVFDRALVRRHRERAAPGFAGHDFLFTTVAGRLAERLGEVRRRFALGLDLGCHTGALARALAGGTVERLVQCDLSPAMVAAAPGGLRLVADEEALPFRAGAFDLIASVLSLHWVNDLPGTLRQAADCLVADGLLLVTLFGGDTLVELRGVLAEAELAESGGAVARISPFVAIRDAGALLQRAGFALPVVDSETLTVTYENPLRLLADLRGMGESNALLRRERRPLPRATLARAMALYRQRHGDSGGRVPASFEILTLTAWKPHPDQPRPLAPGSAEIPLARAFGSGGQQGSQLGDQGSVGGGHRKGG